MLLTTLGLPRYSTVSVCDTAGWGQAPFPAPCCQGPVPAMTPVCGDTHEPRRTEEDRWTNPPLPEPIMACKYGSYPTPGPIQIPVPGPSTPSNPGIRLLTLRRPSECTCARTNDLQSWGYRRMPCGCHPGVAGRGSAPDRSPCSAVGLAMLGSEDAIPGVGAAPHRTTWTVLAASPWPVHSLRS